MQAAGTVSNLTLSQSQEEGQSLELLCDQARPGRTDVPAPSDRMALTRVYNALRVQASANSIVCTRHATQTGHCR